MQRDIFSRNTIQRKLIFDVVKSSMDHPTAESVYKKARKLKPNISLATVYRNLAVLEKTGKIRRIPSDFGPDRYDFNLHEHHHFFCTKCKKVYDISPDFAPLKEQLMAPEKMGYDIKDYSLSYSGICPKCRNGKNS